MRPFQGKVVRWCRILSINSMSHACRIPWNSEDELITMGSKDEKTQTLDDRQEKTGENCSVSTHWVGENRKIDGTWSMMAPG